jgi:signal transduction histidine kinase
MSSFGDPAEATLATITAHLRAAEAVLGEADPVNPAAACQAALVEVHLASAAHRQYLRAISHDLRNTLTSISGLAQMIERSLAKGTLTPERTQQALQRIEESVTRAAGIINRLTEH